MIGMQIEAGPTGSAPTTYNVLFVCTGNTCRSPMAEVLARQEVERRNWSNVRVRSAGVAAEPGLPASAHALDAVRELGLDLSGHASNPLDPDLIEWADLILTMSPSHLGVIDEHGAGHKAALLGDFVAGYEGGGAPVSDPFGGDASRYRATLAELRGLIARALDRLTPIVQP
jgi:protein-tyrosine-phosphatase